MRLRHIFLFFLMTSVIAIIHARNMLGSDLSCVTVHHEYDANRLVQATYGEGDALTSRVGRYSEGIGYDAHGNVTRVTRNGKTSQFGYGLMDDLTLSYFGNRLTGVTEAAPDYDVSGSFEYKRANGSEYMYDNAGSLAADMSRGIAYATHDTYGAPQRICFTNGSETSYAYSASGRKLRVTHIVAKPNITRRFGVEPSVLTQSEVLHADTTDYLLGGSVVLKDGRVDMVLFDGGYAKATHTGPSSDTFSFHYYNKDHLGNNREVVDSSGTVRHVTNYYPFGTPYADPATLLNASFQPYKYNGKELDRMHGLDTYDYGARQYDPILARWDRMDSMAEKKPWQSPYVYGRNNPIRYIDPDGNDDFDKVMGYIVGITTNIIPFSGAARDLYSPTDAGDYNNALRNTDNAMMAIGEGMSNLGKGGTAMGLSILATSGAAVVVSGGTATIACAPAAAAGATLTGASAATGLTGNLLKMNAASNKDGGYNRGSNTPVNSKTVWYSKGKDKARIDVENPKGRKGQIHYQQGNKKYIYNSKDKAFTGAPNKVNDLLKRKDVQNAIKKGQKYLGE